MTLVSLVSMVLSKSSFLERNIPPNEYTIYKSIEHLPVSWLKGSVKSFSTFVHAFQVVFK